MAKVNYEVVGVEYISYMSKKQNKKVEGIVVYAGLPVEKGKGFKCDVQCFIAGADLEAFEIGDEVLPLYNKFGNVVELKLM